MGLIHPNDLAAWQRWLRSRHRLRQIRHAIRPGTGQVPEAFVLTTYDPEPRLLVALDSSSPTSHAALVEPLARLDVPVAVLAPGPAPDIDGRAPLKQQRVGIDLPDSLRGVGAVVSLGHYLPRGELAHRWASSVGVRSVVVQHGALTPYAPPLPAGAHLLAWSAADAAFWASGRPDVDHQVVGSQLLWQATDQRPGADADTRLTYLGQMHAAELPRPRLAHAAATFCLSNEAVYRPHPSECDLLSRLTHDGFRRKAITVDGSTPLARLAGPVVSVFSTGVIEAAAQGRDAWVAFPRPPSWLGEFWERYGMHRLGASPTPMPERPAFEPAANIAVAIRQALSA
jgi:hypothetical protein